MFFVDYNQVALANIFMFLKELKGDVSEKEVKDICRHGIITSLISYKKKFSQEYGEIIITADYGNYWREDIFPEYKANREKGREESNLNWDLIFKCLNDIRDEIKETFPWRLLRVPRCEADDIIAILCKYTQNNEFSSSGMFDEPQSTLIIASDGDNQQLTIYDNVRQWCPRKKAYLPKLSKKELKMYTIEHVVKGDSGDGIPNIFMHENFFVEKTGKARQKSVTQNVLDLFFEHGQGAFELLPMEKQETESKYRQRINQAWRRYEQNAKLVLYENIPSEIEKSILESYHNSTPVGSVDAVRKYFIKNRCRLLMDELPTI